MDKNRSCTLAPVEVYLNKTPKDISTGEISSEDLRPQTGEEYEKASTTSFYSCPVEITQEEDGGFSASCPILPGVHSEGETWEEAIEMVTDALQGMVVMYSDLKQDVPWRQDVPVFAPGTIFVQFEAP